MTPYATATFLSALAAGGILSDACRAADVSYAAIRSLVKRDADFAAAFDDAMEEAQDEAERELRRRAIHGVEEPVVYQGQFTAVRGPDIIDADGASQPGPVLLDSDGKPRVLTINRKSDAALMFLLKGRRKKVFAERTEITGADGGALQIDEGARASRVAQLLALAKSRAQALADDLGELA